MIAKQCNSAPADVIGIADPAIAFAFNAECAEAFYLWEQEQEAAKMASLLTGAISGQTGPKGFDVGNGKLPIAII